MKNKKTKKVTTRRVRDFNERYFRGEVIARFMSQKEQDDFSDKYTQSSMIRKSTVMRTPSKEDFAISLMYSDGKYISQIARELDIEPYAVQSALERVGRYMILLNGKKK